MLLLRNSVSKSYIIKLIDLNSFLSRNHIQGMINYKHCCNQNSYQQYRHTETSTESFRSHAFEPKFSISKFHFGANMKFPLWQLHFNMFQFKIISFLCLPKYIILNRNYLYVSVYDSVSTHTHSGMLAYIDKWIRLLEEIENNYIIFIFIKQSWKRF